jgi:hypothetical protein
VTVMARLPSPAPTYVWAKRVVILRVCLSAV